MPPSAILLIFLKAKKNKKSIKLKADSNYKAISKPTYGNTHITEGKKQGISNPLPQKKKKKKPTLRQKTLELRSWATTLQQNSNVA